MVGWIENKTFDLAAMDELLAASRGLNWWANFGPVSRELEIEIAEMLNVADDQRVVATSSGTVALEVLASLESTIAGSQIRWAASAFSFLNIGSGRFADCVLVDCDERGLLSPEALARLDPDCFDGVIITNPFGFVLDGGYLDLIASVIEKPIIVDNAAGAGFPWHFPYPAAYSFHHTKPFGFGEGGAVVVPQAAEPTVRALLNLGRVPGSAAGVIDAQIDRRTSMNGKISDIAASAILARLRRRGKWVPRYQVQAQRISELAHSVGLETLPGFRASNQTTNCVPIVCESHQPIDVLLEAIFAEIVLARYFEPLAPNVPTARRLFERIVLFPSHCGLEVMSDHDLRDALQRIHACTAE